MARREESVSKMREQPQLGARSLKKATDPSVTFPNLLLENARTRGSQEAIREKDYGIWQSWTWAQVASEVRALACGLTSIGFKRGDKLAIIGDNRPQLYWSIVATQAVGGVPVPLYQDAVAEEMQYILEHTDAHFAIVENQEQVDKVLEIKGRCPKLQTIIYKDPRGLRHYDQPFLHAFAHIQEQGRTFDQAHSGFFENEVAKSKGNDLAILLYTSGTTGRPKGVMLSYDNLVKTARNAIEFDNLTDREEVLAYLPMAWVGDNIFSFAQSYVAGFCVSCPESSETVLTDMREIGPTYFFAAAHLREHPDDGDDPDGRCRLVVAADVPFLHGRSETRRHPSHGEQTSRA